MRFLVSVKSEQLTMLRALDRVKCGLLACRPESVGKRVRVKLSYDFVVDLMKIELLPVACNVLSARVGAAGVRRSRQFKAGTEFVAVLVSRICLLFEAKVCPRYFLVLFLWRRKLLDILLLRLLVFKIGLLNRNLVWLACHDFAFRFLIVERRGSIQKEWMLRRALKCLRERNRTRSRVTRWRETCVLPICAGVDLHICHFDLNVKFILFNRFNN